MKIFPEPDQSNDGAVRPPPPPPIAIRTMESDVTSVEQSGGGKPTSEVFNLPAMGVKRPEPPQPPDAGVKIKVPGYSGPEEKLFAPEVLPEQPPEVVTEKKSFKIIPIIIMVLVAALIGALGYYFVYPLFVQVEDASQNTNPAPLPKTETPTPPAPSHAALISSDKTEIVTTISLATSETPESAPILKEAVLQNESGGEILLSEYLPKLLPEFTAGELIANFEEDFTAYIYYDANGAWPGYVLKKKNGVSPLIARDSFGKVESSQNLKNLFLADPGTASGEWRSGEYKGVSTRYLPYSEKSAAIDYAWANDDVLILTTYFPALKEVLDNRLIK